jgi:hypothetical protein
MLREARILAPRATGWNQPAFTPLNVPPALREWERDAAASIIPAGSGNDPYSFGRPFRDRMGFSTSSMRMVIRSSFTSKADAMSSFRDVLLAQFKTPLVILSGVHLGNQRGPLRTRLHDEFVRMGYDAASVNELLEYARRAAHYTTSTTTTVDCPDGRGAMRASTYYSNHFQHPWLYAHIKGDEL